MRKDNVDFCKEAEQEGSGECQEKEPEGHFGYILTVQLSQAVSQVLSCSSHPSGHSLLWFWKSHV